jgi:chorismate mutase
MKKYLLLLIIALGISATASAQTKTPEQINADLAPHRKEIDSLDKLLIQVLGQRQRVVKQVGIYKKKHNVPPLQPNRFKQVVDRAIAAGKNQGLSAEFITELMNVIHHESLRIEEDSVSN